MTPLARSSNSLFEVIEGVARRAGDRPALVDADRCLTYAAVSDLGARLSGRLLADPARASAPVVALGSSHIEASLGLIAALGARRPYVVLDADLPVARLAAVLETFDGGTLLAGAGTAALSDAVRGRGFDVLSWGADDQD